MTHHTPDESLARLGRRSFLTLSATVGASVLAPAAHTAPAVTPATDTTVDAVVGFVDGDHAPARSPLDRWGENLTIALDLNRRSVGADLGSVQDFTAIELARSVAGEDDVQLQSATGLLGNDTDPATGAFANFSLATPAALDFRRRSMGVDLFATTTIRRVTLVARDETTRVEEADYTLWASDDNVAYEQVTGWSFTAETVDGRLVHTFEGFEVSARYVKVNTRYADDAFTFVLQDPHADFRVFGTPPAPEDGPAHRLSGRDLSVHVSDNNDSWTKIDNVELVNVGSSLWLYGFTARARYVKVHCHRAETTGWTFTLTDIQAGLRVHRIPMGTFVGAGGGTWQYRTLIRVRNPRGQTLRDRAAYVGLEELGVDSLVAAGRLQPDLRDLRFATLDGAELHAYADGRGIYVRIPRIEHHRELPIYAYSGNPAATNRVVHDTGALQVEYGQRTLTEASVTLPDGTEWGPGVKVVRLPNGTLMAAGGAPAPTIHARFSDDGGWTWSNPEPILPLDVDGLRSAGPGGFIVDPETGVLSFFFFISTAHNGGDYMDPEQNNVQIWVAQAHSYDDGRPIFGPPRHLQLHTIGTNRPANWAISYSNGIRTRAGSYLYPLHYMITSEGAFASNVIRSTDGGATWQQSPSELTLPDHDGFERGLTGKGIAELSDGRVLMLARQQQPREYYLASTVSGDDGLNWDPVTNSTILSTNIAPALSPDSLGGVVLAWPGHNAFGHTSYYRNTVTAAYSDDDGDSWHGYQDLLGGSSLSTPGWAHISETRNAINVDSWAVSDTDRVFAWTGVHKPGQLMLIEDFDAFLRDSHGALDVIAHRSESGASNGTELAAHRWWRTTRSGALDLAPGSRMHRRAVRLTPAVESDVGASRLFPAVRQGRISFGLRWSELTTDLHLCMQEGFSAHHNARGTVLSLALAPNGDLLATTDDIFDALPEIGHANQDVDPATGNLTALGLHQAIRFDFQNRSIGADLFEVTEVTGVQLVDNDLIGRVGNRVEPGDLSVWISDTNHGDWQLVEGWTGTKEGALIELSGPAVQARYIKVSHPYEDADPDDGTFTNDSQRILRVLPDRAAKQHFAPLDKPANLAPDEWHVVEIDLDLPANHVTVSVDGAPRATMPQLHAAEVVTHLLLTTAASESGDVRVDELIVQDTSLGLPEIGAVGPTTRIPTGTG